MTWKYLSVPLLGVLFTVGCEFDLSAIDPPVVPEEETSHHGPLFNQEDPTIPKDEIEYRYDGVDILFVVDNSKSMAEEQGKLSSAVFSLTSALAGRDAAWPYPSLGKIRIGVTSSDMGLQYESGPSEAIEDVTVSQCEPPGDNGQLLGVHTEPLSIPVDQVPCVDAEPSSCPQNWVCGNLDAEGLGTCVPTDADNTIDCGGLDVPESYIDYFATGADLSAFGTQAACALPAGINGCGIEQQLKAATIIPDRNLEEFLTPGALLAVFVVTDEDDCSIEDATLFETEEFSNTSLNKINVACNIHNDLLIPVAEIRQRLIDAKGGDEQAVIFGAVAGMPRGATCEGGGHNTSACLELDEMQFQEIEHEATGQFVAAPACTVTDGTVETTSATPGRRIVALAQEFSEYGYTYSVCNLDYQWVMEDFATQILRAALPFEPVEAP